jgi:hypothetical protein
LEDNKVSLVVVMKLHLTLKASTSQVAGIHLVAAPATAELVKAIQVSILLPLHRDAQKYLRAKDYDLVAISANDAGSWTQISEALAQGKIAFARRSFDAMNTRSREYAANVMDPATRTELYKLLAIR